MEPDRLDPIAIGLGAADGYAADDLTSVRGAAVRGEVPYLAEGSPDVTPLELRIHGVGGAPPAENLETPATLQLSGDGTAGFFRAWYPGSRDASAAAPHREAYCWGGLNTKSRTRALWLLLVAFMLVNLGYWAVPHRGPRVLTSVARACLRLLGLALTVAFTGTAVTLLGDIVALQAAGKHNLPGWAGSYQGLAAGPRLAIALLIVLAVLGAVILLSVQTMSAYEKWSGGEVVTEDADWPMTHPAFWHGERTVSRQRYCHVAAAAAEVMMFAVLPARPGTGRSLLLGLAAAIGIVAVLLVVTPWTERSRIAGWRANRYDRFGQAFAYGTLALSAGTCVARFWWAPDAQHPALPGDQALQTTVVFVEYGLVVVLAIAVLLQAPWANRGRPMAFGLAAPLLAGLGCCVGSIFGAALTLAVANVLGSPKASTAGADTHRDALNLPNTVFSGGFGMVVALLCVVVFGLLALVTWRVRSWRWSRPDGPDTVARSYPMPGGAASYRRVSRIWAMSSLTDLAPAAITVVVVPTSLLLIGDQLYLTLRQRAVDGFVQQVSAWGGTIGVVAIGYFLVQLRTALNDASARKRVGVLWDVGTFWPRACHPFAPPCYAERSIPELVTRVRRIVGDVVRCDEASHDPAVAQQSAEKYGDPALREQHRPVLITGYSQGTAIAVATVAQLPPEVRDRVALLTLAAPVRRLYGRAFPAYFGADALELLQERLTDGRGVRWLNSVRRSDYIGGWVLHPIPPSDPAHPDHAGPVDHEILDPPALWVDADPTPPPAHLHLNLFQDPQALAFARRLLAMLR